MSTDRYLQKPEESDEMELILWVTVSHQMWVCFPCTPLGIAPLCAQGPKGPNLKLTPEQGSLETLAEDDGRDHPAAATPGVVPAGPKRDRGAASAESGPRASAADTEPGEGQETNGRHTWRTSATCLSCVSRRTSDSPRIRRRRRPSSAAQGHLHAPLQRGSRSPACGPALPGAETHHAHPTGRHFREQRFAPPSRRDGTSGSRGPRRLVELELSLSVYVCVPPACLMPRGQVLDPLELKLQVIVSCHVDATNNPGPFTRPASALNH
ncbi:uncharacterized protein LOC128108811 [Peromyscus californicus insignis]|uniref:uncharacterized protein LOC128108811 n=1 Tax=Peromyscus californicus insignis TaxID=564181 RepID=UPI0022A7F5ED|nr:uncharacterized protein LOC128108811 [Peromyscus californicus insignis]